jgi:aldose 1-epimerase
VLELKTNQLGIQFYTGNFLLVKNNGHYSIHQGFCLETHNYPNSVNMNHFPTCILEPGEQYSNTNVLSFLIE